jgi:hypothetical protein
LKTEETMNTPKRLALAIAMIALVPALAQAQSVYRWVDKSGKVHYSDQPPPEEVKNVQQKRVGGGGSALWSSTAPRPAARLATRGARSFPSAASRSPNAT